MTTHNILQVFSENVEYGTPLNILESARKVLGFISLDPSSNQYWNQFVKSNSIYTKEDNGLTKPWFGNVWMNHPFGKTERVCQPDCKKKTCQKRGYHILNDILGNEYWILKLLLEHERKNINQSLNICYSSTSEKWYQPLLNYPTCFLHPRTNYIGINGKKISGVQKGSSVTYIGPNVSLFRNEFSKHGKVMLP